MDAYEEQYMTAPQRRMAPLQLSDPHNFWSCVAATL
jgi:hypothetical protein